MIKNERSIDKINDCVIKLKELVKKQCMEKTNKDFDHQKSDQAIKKIINELTNSELALLKNSLNKEYRNLVNYYNSDIVHTEFDRVAKLLTVLSDCCDEVETKIDSLEKKQKPRR